MANQSGIIRPATEAEKKDYIEIGSRNFRDEFRMKAVQKEQEHVKKFKPYCFKCAMMDFNIKVDNYIRKLKNVAEGSATVENTERLKMKPVDLDKYGEKSYFNMDEPIEVRETQVLDGIKQPNVLINYKVKFTCKNRGHPRTIFFPLDVYKERFGKKEEVIVPEQPTV